jgi:Transposase DDE domain
VSEIAEAERHIQLLQEDDLVILDRGYCSYRMMESIMQTKGHFLIRCTTQSFAAAQRMFTNRGNNDRTTTIYPSAPCRKKYGDRPYAKKLRIRFVRVILASGETEVLATSLTDKTHFPTEVFKDLYWMRWGVETFYGILKTRLTLENFSGLGAESIQQDFHAAIFLSGLESILTEDSETSLAQKETAHVQKVNKAVSFHIIKHRAFELFMGDKPITTAVEELTELFLKLPTLSRKDRNPPRRKRNSKLLLNFWKRSRKHVF